MHTSTHRLEALLDAPCASLALPVVRRLHLSFRSPDANIVVQVVVQLAVAQAEAVPLNHCNCYHASCFGHPTPPLSMLVAREAACPLHSQGTISGSLHSLVPFGGRHQDCFHAGTTLFGMIHCLCTTCSCICTSRAIVCVTTLLKVRRNGARRTCRNSDTNGGTGIDACGCNTHADPDSAAIVLK